MPRACGVVLHVFSYKSPRLVVGYHALAAWSVTWSILRARVADETWASTRQARGIHGWYFDSCSCERDHHAARAWHHS